MFSLTKIIDRKFWETSAALGMKPQRISFLTLFKINHEKYRQWRQKSVLAATNTNSQDLKNF